MEKKFKHFLDEKKYMDKLVFKVNILTKEVILMIKDIFINLWEIKPFVRDPTYHSTAFL